MFFYSRIFLSNGWIQMDYPRCPQCQYSLVRCKRLSSLVNQIHEIVKGFPHVTSETSATRSIIETKLMSAESLRKLKLPEAISVILDRHRTNSRHHNLTHLFIHVLTHFNELDDDICVHRDKIIRMIYDRMEKKGSIFFTQQQWTDLECEYNRLRIVEYLQNLKQKSDFDDDSSDIETVNDILFGPNRCERLAVEMSHGLLKTNVKEEEQWDPILSDLMTWGGYQTYRWTCDRKWFVCPKSKF